MDGKYRAYPEYKSAESKWLDIVPESWVRSPLKYLVAIRITDGPHETPEFVDEGVPFLSAESIKNNSLDFSKKRGYITRALHELYGKKCLPQIDDVLMVKSGNTTGALAIVETDEEFNIWSPLALIRANKVKVLPRFVFYSMQADFFRRSVELSWSQGTQPNIGMGVIENLHIAIASLDEQQQITNFLDHETAKIDTLIEKQQQLIKLLKEKRQAVISHAVTKGLKPNAPMRDSGVEWLGEVPAHWTVCRVKQVAKLESGHTPDKKVEEYWINCNIPWVSLNDSTQLKEVDYISNTAYYVNEKGIAGSSARILPTRCVVFTRDASIGLAAITTREMAVSQHIIAWVCNEKKVIPEYLLLVFYAMKEELDRFTFGATLKTIGMPDVRKLMGAFPNKDEQERIVEHVSSEKEKIDILISKANKMVGIINERRTALISAAVTGKIDVRNWQAPEQNPADKEVAA